MDHEILDRLEGLAIKMSELNWTNPGWSSAWVEVQNFIKQERLGIKYPYQVIAVPVGLEDNNYVVHVVPYDATSHAEE